MTLCRFPFVAFALALVLPLVARAAPESPRSALERQLTVNQERYGVVGQAVLVSHNGRMIFRGVQGKADVATGRPVRAGDVLPVFSLAKLFTSTLLMQLAEQGNVDLDKPASDYVRALPPAWKAITVRQFADHTSGVPEYFGDLQASSPFAGTLQSALAALDAKPLQFAPGTTTRYTQTNYLVLTALLEAHYGKPYRAIVQERIIGKLKLASTWLGAAAVPKRLKVTSYISKSGRLEPAKDIPWPAYSHGHAELYTTLDDLATFLDALRSGALVGSSALNQMWQPRTQANEQRGGFAKGWEVGDSGEYRHVGHDGGAQVRVRLAFKESVSGDGYLFIYLTNGSVRNVWSRTLVDSVMAAVAPEVFAKEALSVRLIDYAVAQARAGDAAAQADIVRQRGAVKGAELEGTVNATGYSVRENVGIAQAARVFEVNTILHPGSADAWDSLAEAYQDLGQHAKAQELYKKAQLLAQPEGKKN